MVDGQPASAWRLSPRGREQCAPLADAVRRHRPGHLVSSSEPKAIETAQAIASVLGLDHSVAAGLEEHHRESVPFLPDFADRVAKLFAQPDERVLGEETAREALARFAPALDDLVATWRWPGPPCLVSHGTVLSLYLADRCGIDGLDLWRRLRCPSLLIVDDTSVEVEIGFDP